MSDDYSDEVGQVAAIEVEEAGGNAVGDHPAGSTSIQLDDASDFPEIETQARLDDTVVDVASVDDETDVLTLAATSPVAVEDGDRVFVHPSAPTTWAHVIVDPTEPALLVEVPFGIKAFTGIAEGDLVRFRESSQTGALTLVEVIGADPRLHASRVDNAEELLLEDQQTLGEKLTEAALDLEAARGRLTAAEQRLNDAFSEIDLLPDTAYVDAAKQQAIDAAAITAQQKADAAENRAKADAAAAKALAEAAQASADGAIRTHYQANPPWADGATQPDDSLGDMWFDTDTGQAYRWNGTTWQLIQDNAIATALAAAQDAQDTADRKVTTYTGAAAPTPPAEGFTTGDLWVDATGKIARWSGTAWVTAVDPKALADSAEANAKAFATTRTDGLAKTLWSTALPGTTTAPQNSVWYQHDAQQRIIAVFTQTAAGTAATWVARPITSEAIDNIDAGIITAGSGTINQLVANLFAAKLADIIQANIGNLTVTGDAHLNEVVAQRIWGDVASFAQVTADQVLAGNIQAVWTITSDGLIIAGDPAGRAVEMDDESITIYDVDADGVRHRSSGLGGPGADSLTLTDATGAVTAGFTEDGTMVAQSGEVAGDMTVGGTSFLGTRADPPAEEIGHLDTVSWGAPARFKTSTVAPSSGGRATGEEWGYAAIKHTLVANRQYRISASVQARPNVTGGYVLCRIRAQDGSANQNSPEIARLDLPAAINQANTPGGYLEGLAQRQADTEVEFFLTYTGVNGATPQMYGAELLVEDIGYGKGNFSGGSLKQLAPPSSGTETPPPSTTKRTYTSTWRASDSATFWSDGSRRSAADAAKDMVQGTYGGTSSQRGVALFAGQAIAGEVGKTMGQALTGGATVESVYLYLTANHTGSSVGARYLVGALGSSSIPSTLGSSVTGSAVKPSTGYVKPGAPKKFQLANDFFSGSNRGVVIGDRSTTSTTYYVRVNGHDKGSLDTRPKVVMTYTR